MRSVGFWLYGVRSNTYLKCDTDMKFVYNLPIIFLFMKMHIVRSVCIFKDLQYHTSYEIGGSCTHINIIISL